MVDTAYIFIQSEAVNATLSLGRCGTEPLCNFIKITAVSHVASSVNSHTHSDLAHLHEIIVTFIISVLTN